MVAVSLRSKQAPEAAKAQRFLDWIRRGGALPKVVAPGDDRPLSGVSGLLLTGGEDVGPERYGEVDRHCERIDRRRDEFEIRLVRAALRRGLPVLAVCRGLQVLAVALGGTLHQDVAREGPRLPGGRRVSHRGPRHADTAHRIRLEPGTRLARLLPQRTLLVNSHHHQGVRESPSPLRVAARAEDGLVEALERPGRSFALAVQWHPERWPRPSSALIRRAFLAACRSRARRRG